MKRHLPAAIVFCALCGGVAADQPGWFLEVADGLPQQDDNTVLLRPVAIPQIAGKDVFNLRAGFRFSDAFSLSAGLNEYLLDNAGRQHCAATDFVCLAGRERAVDYGTAYSFSLAPSLRLDDDLSVYGHLGVQGWQINHGADFGAGSRKVLFGLGVGYDISNPFRLQLEYRSMDLDIKLTSIGFSWRF